VSRGDGRAYCPGGGHVVRTRQGVIRPHYIDGARCIGSGQALIPTPPADRCAHSSTMRLGDRRVCTDCGEPRP
jgi:hypothetical protein